MQTKIYNIDFASGKLINVQSAGLLSVGQIVTYEDRANSRKEYVVTGEQFEGHGQPCTCEDGHKAHVSRVDIEGHGGWHLGNSILSNEEITAFLATAATTKAENDRESKAAAEVAATARAEAKAKAIRDNPHLERVPEGGYPTAKLAAKNIRTELKRGFPGIKFSVTSDVYSGGDSVDVRWYMGPTVKEVEKITGKYQEGSFNGMEDIYEYDSENVWDDLFGGSKYVIENREDGEVYDSIAGQLCAFFAITPPEDGKAFWNLCGEQAETVRQTTRALLSVTSFPAGTEAVTVERMPEGERNPLFADYHGSTSHGEWFRLVWAAPAAKTPLSPAQAQAEPVSGVVVSENEEKNGVEVRFPAKPAPTILEGLKAHGFRWSRYSSCWYQRRTAEAVAFARSLSSQEVPA